MALNAYLKLKGKKQGDIKGSVTQKGREGLILVHAFSHEIKSPRDVASGQATGKRQHGLLTITKEIDKSTPLLFSAMVGAELMSTCELRCYAPSTTAGAMGVEVNHFNIILTNASIAGIKEALLHNSYPENVKLPFMEDVSFLYEKIQWVWTDGSITATDDWSL
jgi:type VI secretion system secreted protein Hcp